MNYVQIINIIAYVGCVALFGVALYFKVKGNAVGAVSELIAMAENTDLAGPEKMAMVVSRLYEMIPAAFKKILNEETLQGIAQWIFDWMKKYAKAYIHSHADDPDNPDLGEITIVNEDLMTDIVTRLVNMGADGLAAYATECGIDPTGMTESDLVRAIILACIIKGE